MYNIPESHAVGRRASFLVIGLLAMAVAFTPMAQAADIKALAERVQTGDSHLDVVTKMGGEPTLVSTQRWLGVETQTLTFMGYTDAVTIHFVLGRVVAVEVKPVTAFR